MSSARARANQKLYHTRLLAGAWRRELDAGEVPARVLGAAFGEACRLSLQAAYGWFLLELTDSSLLPDVPPANTHALPSVAPGKHIAPEIREFQQLEQSGWLAEVLSSAPAPQLARTPRANLVGATLDAPEPAQFEAWAEQLATLFDRMSDSLEEY